MKKMIIVISFLLVKLCYSQESDTLSFENVNVIPMIEEIVLKNQRVIITNGKILSIEPMQNISKFNSQLKIDGTGKYLIPGLSEMHYHWRNKKGGIERDFKLLIANGITTVRNMAEYDWQNHVTIRDSIKKGSLFGPNYYTTGPYLKAENLEKAANVTRVIKSHKDNKYDFLKLADNLQKDIYLKLLEEAYNNNIPIIGHGQHNLPLDYSLRIKSIEHVEEFVYIISDSLKEDPEYIKSAVKQIKNSGITLVPTLVVFDMIMKYLDDEMFKNLGKINNAKYLLSNDLEYWLSDENPYRKDLYGKEIKGLPSLALLKNYFKWMKKFTKLLYESDVPLMTGSDTFGLVVVGYSLHEEFEFLNEVGLTPFDILKASTVTPARYLETISLEGTISEGKNANLVLLNKNPLDDIRNTKTIEGVMLKGEWLDRNKLDKMLKEVEHSR